MLMGTLPAASKPFSPPLRSITPPLPVCFVLTYLYSLSFLENSFLLLSSCKVTFHPSASVYFFLPSLPLLNFLFSLSSLMNGVAGL